MQNYIKDGKVNWNRSDYAVLRGNSKVSVQIVPESGLLFASDKERVSFSNDVKTIELLIKAAGGYLSGRGEPARFVEGVVQLKDVALLKQLPCVSSIDAEIFKPKRGFAWLGSKLPSVSIGFKAPANAQG